MTIQDRRRGRSGAYGNAATWAIGNGLVSTTLVIYLARDLGASSEFVGWIVAAPQFVGVWRLATREQPAWIVGAWALWIGYVGLNVALPSLMLKLAPPGHGAGYVALFFAMTGVCYGLSSVAGGWLADALPAWMDRLGMPPWIEDHYDLLFLGGAAARALGVVWLWRLIEAPQRE